MSCFREYCPHCKSVQWVCEGFCNACQKSIYDNEEKAKEEGEK